MTGLADRPKLLARKTFRLPLELDEDLAAEARRRGCSENEIIVCALERELAILLTSRLSYYSQIRPLALNRQREVCPTSSLCVRQIVVGYQGGPSAKVRHTNLSDHSRSTRSQRSTPVSPFSHQPSASRVGALTRPSPLGNDALAPRDTGVSSGDGPRGFLIRSHAMTCPRCKGLMVPDHPFRFSTSSLWDCTLVFDEPSRCLNCGNILSEGILGNRSEQLDRESRRLRTIGVTVCEAA